MRNNGDGNLVTSHRGWMGWLSVVKPGVSSTSDCLSEVASRFTGVRSRPPSRRANKSNAGHEARTADIPLRRNHAPTTCSLPLGYSGETAYVIAHRLPRTACLLGCWAINHNNWTSSSATLLNPSIIQQ